MRVKHGQAKF